MTIDTDKLRERAQECIIGAGNFLRICETFADFRAEATPKTILALLNELDHLREQIRQHEAFQQFANSTEQQRLNDARREGWKAAQEKAAEVCDEHARDTWNLYKGRHPYTGKEDGRADPHVQGTSSGADECEERIRAMQPPAEWASSEQCGAAPHDPDHVHPA